MIRSFENVEFMLRDDGRTVEGRVVPYGEVADIVEPAEDGTLVRYKETFLKRSCARLAQHVAKRGNAAFIELRLDHGDDFNGKVGYATTLDDREDGAYATFRLYESPDLQKVRSMLKESHNGLSVSFREIVPPRITDDGITQRVQVLINHVAATPIPTYEGAGITAMRDADVCEAIGTPALDAVKEFLASLRA